MEPIKYPSIQTMCEARLKAEGRGEELKERRQKFKESLPPGRKFHWSNDSRTVMKAMGMKTKEEEQELFRERMHDTWLHKEAQKERKEAREQAEKDAEEKAAQEVRDAEKAEKARLAAEEKARKLVERSKARSQQTFESAVAELPKEAPESDVLQWIAAHPALSRMDRSDDKSITIKITTKDLNEAPHGPCPSMKAARDLQHWANAPGKFRSDYHEMMRKVTVAEKAADTGPSAEEEEVLPDEYKQNMAEIREMLSGDDGDDEE
jgi:hypothetical protein